MFVSAICRRTRSTIFIKTFETPLIYLQPGARKENTKPAAEEEAHKDDNKAEGALETAEEKAVGAVTGDKAKKVSFTLLYSSTMRVSSVYSKKCSEHILGHLCKPPSNPTNISAAWR